MRGKKEYAAATILATDLERKPMQTTVVDHQDDSTTDP